MSVTVTTTESWGSRLGGAFKGILVGIVLVLGAIALLWWNEGRSVKRADSLQECQKITVSVPSSKLDPQYNGKPIHTTGKAIVNGELADPLFPKVKVKAISLSRNVEMYQWEEESHSKTEKNTGGSTTTTTTYTYKTAWHDSVIDSSAFKESGHNNPAQMAVGQDKWDAAEVTLGAFRLPVAQARTLPSKEFKPNVPESAAQPLAGQAIAQPAAGQAAQGQAVAQPGVGQAVNPQAAPQGQAAPGQPQPPANANPNAAAPTPAVPANAAQVASTVANALLPPAVPEGAIVVNGRVFRYVGGYWYSSVNSTTPNPAAPQVGDLRIAHTYVPEQDASVIAVQQDGTFTAFTAKNGYTVFEIVGGIKPMDAMFASAMEANKMMTWLLRLLGLVVMFVGFKLIFAPLAVLADVLPFFGNLVGYGTSFIAFILAAGLSLLTIGVAWVFYRPLLGIALLVVGVGLIVYLFKGRGQKTAAPAAADNVPAPTDNVPPAAPQA